LKKIAAYAILKIVPIGLQEDEEMKEWTKKFKEFLVPGSTGDTGEKGEVEEQEKREAAPTGQNSVRSGSYFSGAGKTKHPLGMNEGQVKMWSLITLALVLLDLAAFGFLASRLLFGLTEKICYAFKMDGLSYVNHSFRQVELMIAYAVDFIIGGALIWLTLSIAGMFAENAFLKLRRKHILSIVAIFAGLFLILTLISIIIGHKYDSYLTYRFMAPLMCYAGGTLFLGLSLLRIEVR
jgi:hypothetical protein